MEGRSQDGGGVRVAGQRSHDGGGVRRMEGEELGWQGGLRIEG